MTLNIYNALRFLKLFKDDTYKDHAVNIIRKYKYNPDEYANALSGETALSEKITDAEIQVVQLTDTEIDSCAAVIRSRSRTLAAEKRRLGSKVFRPPS